MASAITSLAFMLVRRARAGLEDVDAGSGRRGRPRPPRARPRRWPRRVPASSSPSSALTSAAAALIRPRARMKRARQAQAADGEVLDGPLRLRAVERLAGHLHLAQAVLFDAEVGHTRTSAVGTLPNITTGGSVTAAGADCPLSVCFAVRPGTVRYVPAAIRPGRSGRGSSPCPRPPRSRARTSSARPRRRRPRPGPAAGSSSRRRGRRGCRST